MSFTKNQRRRFEAGRSRFALPPLVASPVVRYVVYAVLAFAFALYGIVSHFSAKHPPLYRHVTPPPAPTYDADAGEMPVPEIYAPDGGSR